MILNIICIIRVYYLYDINVLSVIIRVYYLYDIKYYLIIIRVYYLYDINVSSFNYSCILSV